MRGFLDEIACKAICKKFHGNGAVACKSSQLFPRTWEVLATVLAGVLAGFLWTFLEANSFPTLSQEKDATIVKIYKNSLKTVVFQFFLRVTDSFPTLSQDSWERVGNELRRPRPLARFFAFSLIPCRVFVDFS